MVNDDFRFRITPMQIHLNVPFPQNHVEFPLRPIGDTAMRRDSTKGENSEIGIRAN